MMEDELGDGGGRGVIAWHVGGDLEVRDEHGDAGDSGQRHPDPGCSAGHGWSFLPACSWVPSGCRGPWQVDAGLDEPESEAAGGRVIAACADHGGELHVTVAQVAAWKVP